MVGEYYLASLPDRGGRITVESVAECSWNGWQNVRGIGGNVRLENAVRQHFREIEQTCGVSGSQLWIMQEVNKTPGIGISELAERLSIHPSTCSLLVEKLVSHDSIIKERSKEDQRRVGLWLTKDASALLKKAPGSAEGILPEALRSMSESALLALDKSLNEVMGQLRIRDDKFADKPLSDLQ